VINIVLGVSKYNPTPEFNLQWAAQVLVQQQQQHSSSSSRQGVRWSA
jgi:hypothetical protein